MLALKNMTPVQENTMLLDADALRAIYKQRLIDYAKHYFIARKHTNKMYSISGQSCFEDNIVDAPQFIFRNMVTPQLKRLTDIYQGVTDNELRFDELACMFGKICNVKLDDKRIRENECNAVADFGDLADKIRFDKLTNEVNTKAKGLELEGKQKAADHLINSLNLVKYHDRVADHVKLTARHAICTLRVWRCQWSKTLDYETVRQFNALQKNLQLVALDTADATLLPVLASMRIDDHTYIGELGTVYGDKSKNSIRMHKESMKLNFTHDSFEALIVWLMTHTTKEIMRLPCPA